MKVAISNYLKILPFKHVLFCQPNKFNMLRETECPKNTGSAKQVVIADCLLKSTYYNDPRLFIYSLVKDTSLAQRTLNLL